MDVYVYIPFHSAGFPFHVDGRGVQNARHRAACWGSERDHGDGMGAVASFTQFLFWTSNNFFFLMAPNRVGGF